MRLNQRHEVSPGAAPIIIVAPGELSVRIAERMDADVVAFASLDELDDWRAGKITRGDTVLADIRSALAELGTSLDDLPQRLRLALTAIGHQANVPAATKLEQGSASRRSFYRMWSESIDIPPSTFLRRVRALHALRLMDAGIPPKEAATAAGFSSVDQMRRHIARKI